LKIDFGRIFNLIDLLEIVRHCSESTTKGGSHTEDDGSRVTGLKCSVSAAARQSWISGVDIGKYFNPSKKRIPAR
jgi:hypothetical protein